MGRKAEGKEKSTTDDSQTIKSALRLSSRLQRAITSSHGSVRLLKDLDEFVAQTFISQLDRVIEILEESISHREPRIDRTAISQQLVSRVKGLQGSIRSMNRAYYATLRGSRKVSSEDLKSLADLDSDLGTSLVYLLHQCSMITLSRQRDYVEIEEILKSIEERLAARPGAYLIST